MSSPPTTSARIARATLIGLGVLAAVGTGLAAIPERPRGDGGFSLRATPSTRTITPGASGRYTLSLSHRGPARFALASRLPRGVRAAFASHPARGGKATLTLRTRATVRPGSYRLALRAGGAGRDARTSVKLVVAIPAGPAFAIRGDLTAALAPGVARAVDVRLTNPHRFALSISRLTVRIRKVVAPGAHASRRCTRRDFLATGFSGASGFRLPAGRTRTLARLGFGREQWPRVAMLDRSVNQDGCKGATLRLAYSGVARRYGS